MSNDANHQVQEDHKEDTIETLRTPPFRIQPAPVQQRIVAALIDSAIIALAWLIAVAASRLSVESGLVIAAGYLVTITFAFYSLQESLFASTVGKQLLRLRVVGRTGDPVSMKEACIRNLLRFVDWLPFLYILGSVVIATSSSRRRLGDVVAGTVVTSVPEKDINPPPAPFLFH